MWQFWGYLYLNNMCCCADQILGKYYACVEVAWERHLAFVERGLWLMIWVAGDNISVKHDSIPPPSITGLTPKCFASFSISVSDFPKVNVEINQIDRRVVNSGIKVGVSFNVTKYPTWRYNPCGTLPSLLAFNLLTRCKIFLSGVSGSPCALK